MNIVHVRYAIEIAKVGSINKASVNLGVAQPNLSRAIKDLEATLGITLFDRSAKGMVPTPDGREFIRNSQKIINQLNELELIYRQGVSMTQRFSLSAPRAGYIAEAFAKFSTGIDKNTAEIVFNETGVFNTIKKVVNGEAKLGIIRYEEAAETRFREMLDKNELYHKDIASFKHRIIMSKENELANLADIHENDLHGYLQITHTNPYEASITASDTTKSELRESSDRCIYVLDTAAQFEILAENPEAFMWVSPVPQGLLDRYGLIERECSDNMKVYKDVLIYAKDYKLTVLDKKFTEELEEAKAKYLNI